MIKRSKSFIALILAFSCLFTGCSEVKNPSESISSAAPGLESKTGTVLSEKEYSEKILPQVQREATVRRQDRIYKSDGYNVVFEGEWDKITDKDYKNALANEFDLVYPRLYARWGTGSEPKTIHLIADSKTEDIACSWEDNVQVQVRYANENTNDVGFLAHELTHNIQSYPVGLKWWAEGLASYGRFRYFHWAAPDCVYLIDQQGTNLINWSYEPYGECVLFFAYLDYKYPTVVDGDKKKAGLIDSIHFAVKKGEITDDSDPYTAGNPFNNMVKKITGYDTIDAVRSKYVEECINGTWVFKGFADYRDNFVQGVEYPEISPVSYHAKSAPAASDVKDYTENVFKDARVIRCSGFINDEESSAKLVDGDLGTKWCAEKGNITDTSYLITGVSHFIVLDLGANKKFSSYTLHNGGSVEDEAYNATSWELLVSDNGTDFHPVDYQKGRSESIAAFETGEVSCRYVMLKIYTPDSGDGTVRLYELSAG